MNVKNRILDVSLELFSDKGYEATGIQEIVEKSGITKPTLYYYFGSKEGLLQAILEKYYFPFLEDLKKVFEYHNDITFSLTKIITLFFNSTQKNKMFSKMSISMIYEPKESSAYKIIYPFFLKIYSMINNLFINASNNHGNMKDREKEFTLSFLGIINVYSLMIINDNIEVTDNLIYKVTHQFMHGIFS